VVICLPTIEHQLLGQIFDIILLWSGVAGPLLVNDRTSSCCGQGLVVNFYPAIILLWSTIGQLLQSILWWPRVVGQLFVNYHVAVAKG